MKKKKLNTEVIVVRVPAELKRQLKKQNIDISNTVREYLWEVVK